MTDKAKTDKVNTGLVLIPFYSILRIGAIFVEGLRYGRDNWKKGVNDKEYQEERLEHALLHLIKYKEGDTSEDHLSKVCWFCITQMELERLENLPLGSRRPERCPDCGSCEVSWESCNAIDMTTFICNNCGSEFSPEKI